jgi:tetratricopeptide (TPR) repeat protein
MEMHQQPLTNEESEVRSRESAKKFTGHSSPTPDSFPAAPISWRPRCWQRIEAAIFLGLVAVAVGVLGVIAPWPSWLIYSNPAGDPHWQQAQSALEVRDYESARKHLGNCLLTCPFHAETHFLMARACRLTHDMASWLSYLQNADLLGWSPEEIDLERRLGEAQSKNIWLMEQELKNKAVDSAPAKKVLIVEALINGYLDNDRARDAYLLAHAWTMDYPDNWLAWLYLGRASQLGMSMDKTIAHYEKSLELKPDQTQVQLWLAQALLTDTQFERSIPHFRIYLQSRPDDPDALLGLAKCQFSQGEVDAARATLDDLLDKQKDHAAGLFARAQLELAESPEKALPWLRQAFALAPNDPKILHNLMLALRAIHQDKEADQYAQRLTDRKKKLTELFELQRQLLKDSSNADLRYQVASVNLELGAEEEAAHWFQTVLWIDPNHGPTLRALADYWRKHKNSQRAAYYDGRANGSMSRLSVP